MINHLANQSQTCQLSKIFFFNIEKKLWRVVQSRVELKRINFKHDAGDGLKDPTAPIST